MQLDLFSQVFGERSKEIFLSSFEHKAIESPSDLPRISELKPEQTWMFNVVRYANFQTYKLKCLINKFFDHFSTFKIIIIALFFFFLGHKKLNLIWLSPHQQKLLHIINFYF